MKEDKRHVVSKPSWLDLATFEALLDLCGDAMACGAPYGKEGCGAADDLTVDHIVPRWAGGTKDLSNLQVLCRPCNSAKGIRESSYWHHTFYWDSPPDDIGFSKLRQPQRELYNEIAHYRPEWFGQRLISEIAHHLYVNVWVVGAGKTLGIPVTAWALNQVIREHWGKGARRVDRILVIVKDQAIRDQLADNIPRDLVDNGIVRTPPTVGIVAHGWQFKSKAWIDSHDILVTCEQQLWEANGSARSDLAEILARFPLIAFDEPHYAPDQISRIVDAADVSLCVGFTGTPVDMWGSLLPRVVALTIYDYQEASDIDRSVKYLDADARHFSSMFVREVDIDDAQTIDHGQLVVTTSTQQDGYNKNIEPPKAVVRGVIEEIKARDELILEHEGPAPHRRQSDVDASLRYPVHAIVYFDNIATAETLAVNHNKMFEANRLKYPAELGWSISVAHSGGKDSDGRNRKPQPLARRPDEAPHPWRRAYKNRGHLDRQCSRLLFVVDMAREGVNNPYCGIIGVACNSSSILDGVQGWLGRQLRAVTERLKAGLRVPPALLDSVRIVTHSTYEDVTDTIRRSIDFICDMRGALDGLPTIDDLQAGDGKPKTQENIHRELDLPILDKVRIVCTIGEGDATGNPPTIEDLLERFAPHGGRRADRVREWAGVVREDPEQARKDLRLDAVIEPITIVMRERIRHSPSDPELERYIRIHERQLIADLPVTEGNRRFFLSLHRHYADQFQQPPLVVENDRNGKPITINRLAKSLVGAPVLNALSGHLTGDEQLVWRYATSAVSRKLGVPADDRLKDGSDWDNPQTHAIIRRPEIQRELVGYVLRRLIDEGHCPSMGVVRRREGTSDAA